jgi:fumarate reductase subunit D
MSDAWYYAEGDKAVGPVSLADLEKRLFLVSNAKEVLVWRDGLANWVKAKNLPELTQHVIKPPPLPIRRGVAGTSEHRKAPEQSQYVQELEPTRQRAISVLWLLYSRGFIGAAIIGIAVHLIIGLIGGFAGVNEQAVEFTSAIVGTLFGFAWVIVVLQMALRKRYRDFRLALIPLDPHRFKAEELEPTWQRAISVWWLICWRFLVGYAVTDAIVVWPISIGLQSIQIQGWVIPFTVSFGIGLVISFVWLIVVLQMALRKRYRHFRIAVVPLNAHI